MHGLIVIHCGQNIICLSACFQVFFSSQESKPLEAEDHVVFQNILLIGQVNELQYFGFELVVFTVSANLLKKKPQKDCQH